MIAFPPQSPRSRKFVTTWTVAIALLAGAEASAIEFNLTTLIDASDVAPPSPGFFTFFENSSFSGDGFTTVASGLGATTEIIGLYDVRSGQPPTLIIDGDAPEPNTGDPFALLLIPQGNGTVTGFFGVSLDPNSVSKRGIYLNNGPGGTLQTVALQGSTVPGVSGTVTSLGGPHIAASDLAFSVETDFELPTQHEAIVTRSLAGGAFTTLVDSSTAVPQQPGKTFFDMRFGPGGYDGSKAVFLAAYDDPSPLDSGEGIYSVFAGMPPELLFQGGVDLPGNALGTEYTLNAPILGSDDVFFTADRIGDAGIYGLVDGALQVVVDTSMPLPHDQNESFMGPFSFRAASNGRVVFVGRGTDASSGVYLYDNGEITPVLTTLDQLDGLPVAITNVSRTGFSGDQILIDVVLADNVNQTGVGQVVLAEIVSQSLPGDFNGDHVVDAVDRQQWESAYGTNDTADADGDGDSDGADFLVWQRQFGMSSLLTAESVSVPEPGGLLLAITLSFVLLTRRRSAN